MVEKEGVVYLLGKNAKKLYDKTCVVRRVD